MTLGANPKRFVICSGGGPGIMEAANRGAAEAGGSSIGLSIQLPHEQRPNPYITPELNFCFHYFFMRKLWFAQMAKALIVFPGGFGTMDELWEMLTLLQTGKLSSQHLILIYGRKYWDKVSTGGTWCAAARSARPNTRCCTLPTPWTKLSIGCVEMEEITWCSSRITLPVESDYLFSRTKHTGRAHPHMSTGAPQVNYGGFSSAANTAWKRRCSS